MWNVLASQADVDHLMLVYRRFHDSCLKEMALQTRKFVDEQRSMNFDNRTFVRMLFQNQFSDASTIEILFEDVVDFNWVQDEKNSDITASMLFEAVCYWQDETLYWAEDLDWSSDSEDRNDYRWIAAKQGRWRAVEYALGPDTRLSQPTNS
ncbi:hypothetical protein LGH70_05695 [Hymenobacter sp. BT635]|uniref:Tim44-like domain-containing protein n=1 Tax=Hymenobacter nitidus TaxID=2880929 RepID=A0ABS8ADF7_9BACT|nr:hypothetical protein [Hymenobacter nitidus]MCB2377064.1 hypothetical protein [Hymenobacter nitidus]